MQSYLESLSGAPIYPKDWEAFEILFNAYMLEKALYELSYEMNNRPTWMMIPLRGIANLVTGTDGLLPPLRWSKNPRPVPE